MRHPIDRKVPRALSLVLLGGAVALGGCKKKDPEPKSDAKAEAKADDPGADEDEAAPPADPPPVVTGTLPVLDEPLAHDKGVVLGHVILTNPAQLLTDLKAYAPPEAAGFMDEAALKALVGMQMGERAKVVQAIDLKKPHGCAVVDIKKYEDAPVACALAYTGGAKQLVADLGDGGKFDADGHLAGYEVEGQKIYVDDLGEYVGLTAYPDLFAKTQTYLQDNIVARGSAPRGDIEAVAFVGDLFDTYEKELQPFLDEMQKDSDLGATSDPRFKQVGELYAAYNKKNSARTVEQFEAMQQATFDLGVDDRGLLMGVTMIAAPDSDAAKLAKDFGGGHIDPALAKSLPEGAWFLLSSHNERGAWKSPQAQEAITLLVEAWAALTKQDAVAARGAVDAFFAESDKLYTDDSAFALADVDGGLFGATLISQTTGPTREAWKTWSTNFTPEAVLGKEGAQYVTWSFEPEHAKVGDVAVDRWIIKPTDKARAEIEKEMSDKDREQVKKFIGELQLVIDRAEVDGRVAWTVAPKAEDAWTRRVVEAQQGKNALASGPGVTAVTGYHPGAAMVFGLDVNGMLDWARGLPEMGDAMKSVPRDLGENLGDVMVVMEYRKDGVSTVDMMISQAVIKDGVKVLNQLSPGARGGLGGL